MESPLPATSSLPSSDFSKTAIVAVNTTVLYLLAYFLVQGVYQLATLRMAARLGIPGVWQLGQIQFRIADTEWWRTGVLAVYGIGPVACAGLGMVAGWWFWQRARYRRGLFKQFLLWVMLHAANLSLGVFVADTLTQSGAWYVPSWLFLVGNVLNVVVALLAGIVQVGLGYLASIAFLHSHDSITLMRFQNRRRLLLCSVLVPWLVGSLLLTLLYWPRQSLSEQLHGIVMLLLLGPLYLASMQESFEGTIRQPSRTQLAVSLLLLLAVVAIGWRLVLSKGITF
ncbi:MAG TPA: hypothetical protein VK364_07000 [Hymenobacter sp.]|nr:hypothetical protein [Hymenobacter sp.]